MRPISPLRADNPVTRTVNMVMSGSGTWIRRKSFSIAPNPGTVHNHIMAEIGGTPYLAVKTNLAFRVFNGTSWSTPSSFIDENDKPVNDAAVSPTERGSFSIHGGELYYADTTNVFAWDGTDLRRPGVKSLAKHVYWNSTNPPGFNLARIETSPVSDPADFINELDPVDPLGSGTNPRLMFLDGEKVLNTGFCFSIYDPSRKIYGRRSEVFSLPYVFGPTADEEFFMTDQRFQYAKRISTPGSEFIPDGHKVAVWFTIGMNVLTNLASASDVPWGPTYTAALPAMSERMTNIVFLEGIFDPDETIDCRKDTQTLFASGRYTDRYARPAPCRMMTVLPNGTALYFFPRTNADDNESAIGNYVEYSEEHPEQVGRDTENDRDTQSPIPNVRGTPITAVYDGQNPLIITRQAVYRIGFTGRSVNLFEAISGRGVRSIDSIQSSPTGLLWMSDEGVILARGGSSILLDARLGFRDWFTDLTDAQKESVAIGVSEKLSHILVAAPDPAGGNRILCYDYENNVTSEFRVTGVVPYRFANFNGSSVFKTLAFHSSGTAEYPGSSDTSDQTTVEFWLSESRGVQKKLHDCVLTLGPRPSGVEVRVDAYQDTGTNLPIGTAQNETFNVGDSSNDPARIVIHKFNSMRGRLFKFTITGASELLGFEADWSADEQPRIAGN